MQLDFNKGNGLIPAIIQDATNAQVLMLGYMNESALEQTKQSKKVTFYSRSKQRLWLKGESSGNYLNVISIKEDCDQDTLLIKAIPAGPTCHTGSNSCFDETSAKGYIYDLESTITQRITEDSDDSYTSSLVRKGLNKVAQKVGEEAVEVVIEAKDNNPILFENECADLLYHLLILLNQKGSSIERIEEVLRKRSS